MIRRLLFLGAAIVMIVIKFAWRDHDRAVRQNEAMNAQMPAFGKMSAATIVGSDWAYSGPLGEMTLRFEPAGKLTVVSTDGESSGRWEIAAAILHAYIPGADAPHHGIFRASTDEMSGPSPQGLQPDKWSATRVR